ncbi:MAG: hypothetical protein Q8P15_01160 [Nanoarchaeota archaeon]|nr:hypothetical protein [Nanoarchaeota archaeon]
MRRGIIFLVLILLIFPIVSSQQAEVEKAVQCLENQVAKNTCSSLTTEEKIFSLLGVQKCEGELLTDSQNNAECWPKSGCTIKQTAQSILALNSVGTSTEKAQSWLLSQTKISTDVLWYLQIDSNEATSCTISYDSSSYSVNLGEDKKIDSSAGECLRLDKDDYWLRVPSTCYDKEFKISCDKSFKTNMIFKDINSPTYFISDKINSGSASSSITEKVKSNCFSTTDSCDYEGTLWGALSLTQANTDASSYIPYLIISANKNERYLPESFLYLLAGNTYYEDLLSLQRENKYWDSSGDKLYDTALALYPLQPETSEAKTNAMNWLIDNQKTDGCWDNIRNTGFILYSVWPLKPLNGTDCLSSGGYCLPSADCEGNIITGTCTGTLKCCSVPLVLPTCSAQNGDICTSNEVCNGKIVSADDTPNCCLGSCTTPSEQPKTECAINGGACKISCGDNEEIKNFQCDYSTDFCCVPQGGSSYWYIWVLLILIVLTTLGIIFRNKFKEFWFRLSSKFKKAPPSEFPSSPQHSQIPRGIIRRRILPTPQQRSPARKPQAQPKRKEELDEVLKKLKEIGK